MTKKLLVLYVAHSYNNRVKHFLEKAVFEDPSIDWVFIYNGLQDSFPIPPYMKKFKRENIGFDFGGWSDYLLHDPSIQTSYDYYLFINSSAYGPYISPSYSGKWTDIFIQGLQHNTKLFGCTINTVMDPLHKSHIQSYVFSMDSEALHYLIQEKTFTTQHYHRTMHEAVWNGEIRMSQLIVKKGWNIGCTWSRFKDVDFTFQSKPLSEYPYSLIYINDPLWPEFENGLWTRENLVFVKGNRLHIH